MELPTQRLASWEESCAGHCPCRGVSLARRLPKPPWTPFPKLPTCHQQGTSTQACLMEQSVAWALLHRKQRGSFSHEVSAAPASFLEELEKIGLSGDGSRLGAAQLERLKVTRESNPSLVIRAHEREIQRDLGVRAVVVSQACSRQSSSGGVRVPRFAEDDRHLVFPVSSVQSGPGHGVTPEQAVALLGLDDPDGAQPAGYTPSEHAALAAFHRDQELLDKHTCQGRKRAEAAPSKAQALQVAFEETQESKAMPTCGPSWTR